MSGPEYLAALARPGDTVVIAYNGVLDEEEIAGLEEFWTGATFDSGVNVHFTDNVASMVVIKGEDD